MATDADPGEPLLYKYDQACEKLGVSISFLYKLMREGKIKRLRLGPQASRIAATELEDYVQRLIKERDRSAA